MPVGEENRDKAWNDLKYLPQKRLCGMKRSMSYMQCLIRHESNCESCEGEESQSKYLEVISNFHDELLNFEVILTYYGKQK